MESAAVAVGGRPSLAEPEFGQGFWVERRVFPDGRHGAAGIRGHVKVTVYLAHCAYLGEEQGPPQAAVTRIATLESLLGLGARRIRDELLELAAEQWLSRAEVDDLHAESHSSRPARVDRFSPRGFRLLGSGGQGCRKAGSHYFRLDLRLLDRVRELGTTGVGAYAYVCRRGSPGRLARFSLARLERQLGLAEGSGGDILRRVEQHGLIRILPGSPGRGLAACHTYERLPWPGDLTPAGGPRCRRRASGNERTF
jgi:hypothetical protein